MCRSIWVEVYLLESFSCTLFGIGRSTPRVFIGGKFDNFMLGYVKLLCNFFYRFARNINRLIEDARVRKLL